MNDNKRLSDDARCQQQTYTEISDLPDTQTSDPNPVRIRAGEYPLMMWLIIAYPETHRGTVLPVKDNALIGRHGDLRWYDMRMSRKHARFVRIADPERPNRQIFAIKPESDRNGTIVNGKRIANMTPLYENDVIVMGETTFVVKVLE
ncbi:MAG: FHA domain-containing protein [Anaerolineae bacterium]